MVRSGADDGVDDFCLVLFFYGVSFSKMVS